jgi:hypothetical protein
MKRAAGRGAVDRIEPAGMAGQDRCTRKRMGEHAVVRNDDIVAAAGAA